MADKIKRLELAKKLMADCPDESREIHQRIADAILTGTSKTDILNMPETNDFPETYHWLSINL